MNKKTKPASALIFTLIILFIGVVSAIGIASSTLIARKMSTTSGKSVASFQVADSGAEIILQKMKDTLDSDSNAKITDMGLSCNNGTVSGSISSGKEYEITFLDENGNQLPAGCSAPISDVQKIRSIGTYAQVSRAIEAAVAAGECRVYSGSTNVGFNNGDTTSSMASVAFSNTCSDPIIVTQSIMDSVSCTTSSADLNSYIANVNQNGFSIYLSAECTVDGLPNGNSFGINWIATCGSCD